MIVMTQAAQADMLADILRDPCTLRLYVNEALSDEPVAADFMEPVGGEYVGKPMRYAAWDLSQAPEEASYPRQTWTFSGPAGLVQGYYVTRNTDGRLRWYEPFVDENGEPAPMRIVSDGDEVSVAITLSFAPPKNETADVVAAD